MNLFDNLNSKNIEIDNLKKENENLKQLLADKNDENFILKEEIENF